MAQETIIAVFDTAAHAQAAARALEIAGFPPMTLILSTARA